jgi:hypothetical protein
MDESLPLPPPSSGGARGLTALDVVRRVACIGLAAFGIYVIWTLGSRLYGEVGWLLAELEEARNHEPMGYVGIHSENPDSRPFSCIREADGRVYLWAGNGVSGQAGWFDVTATDLPLRQFVYAFGRDRIKTIDYPIFQKPSDTIARRIYAERLVIGLEFAGEARAYPLTVLEKCEVVNEDFGGRAMAVTYCPLRQEAAIYERELDGQPISFGTSGYVYENAFVLYDRATDSLWWPTSEGLSAITGPLAGKVLPLVRRPDTTRWGDWRRHHPDTVVLVGADRSHGIPIPQ